MCPSHNPRGEWIHTCHCKFARSISGVAWSLYSNLENEEKKDKTSTFQKFLGHFLGSYIYSRLRLEHLLRYLRALPTIRVHPELVGRTLEIVHSLNAP